MYPFGRKTYLPLGMPTPEFDPADVQSVEPLLALFFARIGLAHHQRRHIVQQLLELADLFHGDHLFTHVMDELLAHTILLASALAVRAASKRS